MDGMETTKHLRDSGYTRPIVALTANAVAGQEEMFLQNGFDEFIAKPIDVRQLDAILNKLVRDKQPAGTVEAARIEKNAEANAGAAQPQVDPRLLKSFAVDARRVVAMLEGLCQNEKWIEREEDLRKFTIAVHGIASSLLNIEEAKFAESAKKLETAGREKNASFIAASMPVFLSELRALLERLDPERETEADDFGKDPEDLRGRFLAIQEMCADYNRKGALDRIAEITSCSKETKVVLDGIDAHVRHSDFEEAESMAAAYIAELTPAEAGPDVYGQTRARLLSEGVAGLDIVRGIDRYEGDEETYLKILRSYAASVRSMLGLIKTVSEDGLAGYKVKVHGIKGASYDIFAEQIGQKAEALEHAASAGDLGFISEHNPPFLEAAGKFIDDISKLLSAIGSDNTKPKKDKPDSGLLLRLRDACEEYRMKKADEAMTEIEKYQYEADGGLADWLRQNIDIMNFQQVVERISGLNLDADREV
jgi:CheY-like chemotaxis protein